DLDAGAQRPSGEACHQRTREGPRLRTEVTDVADPDSGLLEDLASYGILQALPRLDEPGQGRPPARGPRGLASQQGPVGGVGDEHDHSRIGSRELLTSTTGAGEHMAGLS